MENETESSNLNSQKHGKKHTSQGTFLSKNANIIALSLFTGAAAATVILTLYFFFFLNSKYERDLVKLRQENQQIKTDNSLPNSIPTQISSKCSDCVEQIYNWDHIKEFYSIKVTDASWIKFQSTRVGIKFDYPIEGNKLVLFEFRQWPQRDFDPSGIEFSWSTRELGAKYGNLSFAWGASRDLKIGRMSVDIYNWIESGGSYYLNSTNGDKYKVEKVFIRDVKNGAQALLYRNICFLNEEFCDDDTESRTLIVNLPLGNRERLESVLFYIPLSFTDADIEKLINSIDFF